MRFKDVATIIEQNRSLIGKSIHGATIEELVPIPIEVEDEFWHCYVETRNAERAFALLIQRLGCIAPNAEFRVDAVCDKDKIQIADRTLIHYNIETIKF